MSDHAIDLMARHQHYVERYKTGQYNNILPYIESIEDDLIRLLSRTGSTRSRRRIADILAKIEASVNQNLVEFTSTFNTELGAFATAQATFTAGVLTEVGEVLGSVPSPTQLRKAFSSRPFNSRLLKDVLNDFAPDQAKFIRNSVASGFAEGRTNQQIIDDIVGTDELQFKDGKLEVTRRQAATMVHTSIQHTAMVTQQAVYDDFDVGHYQWLSTLDSRTSPICRGRDGEIFVTGKGPIPPAHFNCRSTTTPLFSDEVEMKDGKLISTDPEAGMRPQVGASGAGTTSAKTTYGTWLRRQPKSFQVDVLGKRKAELFRDGGLAIDKFVDGSGRSLTLKELRSKYSTAWGKSE